MTGLSRDMGALTDAYDVARDLAALLEAHDVITSAEVTSYEEGYKAAHIAVTCPDVSFVLELRGVEPA